MFKRTQTGALGLTYHVFRVQDVLHTLDSDNAPHILLKQEELVALPRGSGNFYCTWGSITPLQGWPTPEGSISCRVATQYYGLQYPKLSPCIVMCNKSTWNKFHNPTRHTFNLIAATCVKWRWWSTLTTNEPGRPAAVAMATSRAGIPYIPYTSVTMATSQG